jgi:Domain of unknown function (DUF5666)
MKIKGIFGITGLFVVAALVLTSCRGGGSMSSANSGMPVIMSGTALKNTSGVTVNGTAFSVGAATITKDDTMESAGSLETGMTVKLKGRISDDRLTGTADKIKIIVEVRGAITSIGTGSFMILGQTILVSGTTFFANSTGLADLKVGDRVEIHGLRDAAGNIMATRVELLGPEALAEGDEVRGIVSNMTATTFDIGGLTITFSATTTIIPPGATFGNGDIVEVRLNGTTAVSIEVERADTEFEPAEGEEAEVEGFISGFTSPSSTFMIGTQPISLASGVTFRGGDASDLGNNILIEAEGTIAAGVLVADKIVFKDTIRIEANADKAGSAGVLGLTITISPATLLVNLPGGIAGIMAGDGLKIRGFLSADGTAIIAKRVIRLDNPVDPGKILLQGPVSSFDATPGAEKLVIAGITVTISGIKPEDMMRDELQVSLADLFKSIVLNRTIVEARGSFSNGVLAATEIDIEDD